MNETYMIIGVPGPAPVTSDYATASGHEPTQSDDSAELEEETYFYKINNPNRTRKKEKEYTKQQKATRR